MTLKQTLFVHHLLGDCAGNATEAVRRSGYAARTANKRAARLLKSPAVAAAIRAGVDAHAMTAAECLSRLAMMGRTDPSSFGDLIACETMDAARDELRKLRRKGISFLVKSITPDRSGRPVVHLHDAADALKLIGRNLGLLRETVRLDLDGQDMDKLSVDELLAIARGKAPTGDLGPMTAARN